MTEPACHVTTWDPHLGDLSWNQHSMHPCGQPLVTNLCAKHEADRVRLGGVA